MKLVNWLFLCLLVMGGNVVAQNGIIGTGFANGWTVPTDGLSFSPSFGSSNIFIGQPNGTGLQYFRLWRNAGDTEFYQNGQFGPQGCAADLDRTANEGENYVMTGCGTVAFSVDVTDMSHNYVFKTPNLFGDPTSFLYFKVEGPIQSIFQTGQQPEPNMEGEIPADEPVLVGVVTTDAMSPGQAVYLRYTTDGFATSTVVPMDNVFGPFFEYLIPAQPDGTTVEYYPFTSGDAVPPAADGSDADYRTINGDTNGGSNFRYTVNRALPVTYLRWTGRRLKPQVVALDWETGTEDQASHFVVECSENEGQSWSERAIVPARNLPAGAKYTFLDEGVFPESLQYRLRQVDFDGSAHLSPMIVVPALEQLLHVWPSPSNGVMNLNVPEEFAGGTARLLSLSGQVLNLERLSSGSQQLIAGEVPAGVYLLRVSSADQQRVEQLRVVIQ
ncbi:T9SS type A sorting domain-containing protein [Lewinella sp. W8]|uniref:T9SS type A sorting domain-containing protein n=1 Tax=Lewinella sp. W8 TaxID=2528208 RepID=UPI001067CDEF|nr:T9SS type A sorting domain-containing protein [Lewinella sp. W8]MTB49733.1 T9SS type A sorting domain-containing protein [Lewinella sp. W8]